MTRNPGKSLVDVHSHFVTDRYVDAAKRAGIAQPDGTPQWPIWSEDDHVKLMDDNGIETAFLSISTPGVSFVEGSIAQGLARHVNQFGSDLARRRPDRFGHLAALPLPNVENACAEATYALDELGSDGVAVESNHRGVYLGDSMLTPLWALLDEREAIVFVHPTSPPNWELVSLGRPRPMLEFLFDTARTVADMIFNRVIQTYPNIQWIFTHSAGVLPSVVDRIDALKGGFVPGADTTSSTELVSRFWFDLAGSPFPHDAPASAEKFGTARLLYGSDYCFTPPAAVAEQVASLDDAERVNGKTWRELTTENAQSLFVGYEWGKSASSEPHRA